MRRHPVVEQLWPEVEATVEGLGYHLVQMTFGGPASNQNLTIYVDEPTGLTADDCASLAEHLSVLLDSLDPIAGHYSLIVSSPGLNRPLGKDEDFENFAGSTVLIRYRADTGKSRRLRGRLLGLENGQVLVAREDCQQAVPLSQIIWANLIYDWEDAGDC